MKEQPKNLQHHILKIISTIAHPVFIFPILTASYFGRDQLHAFFVVFLLSFIVPFSYFLYLYKTRQVSNFDVSIRKQRYRIFAVTLVGLVLSLIYLYFYSTSEIFMDFARLLLIAVILVGFNFKIKVSIHTALITILCFSLVQDFSMPLWVFLLVPLVAYSRLVLKRHQLLEVILGFAIPAVFYVW